MAQSRFEMSPIPAYEREPYRSELPTEVLRAGTEGDRPFAVLADTLLYPEGGGQPADRGWLDGVAVVDVQRSDGEIRHYLERPASPGPATVTLDWPRRFDHMQQHTAQHLLTALAADRLGWATTSFHLGPEVSDIELDTPEISTAARRALEEAVVAEILADRPLTARRVSAEAMAGLSVRTRGLPAGHRGDVRLVEIEGIDLNTCGGTHLRSTGEIETLKLLGTEPLRGGTRLFWVAGARVRRRLEAREGLLAELRSVLGAGDEELPGLARLKLEQLQEAERRRRRLEGRLAEAVADGLGARPEPLVAEHFEGADAGFLQLLARRFSETAQPAVALLTASGEKGAFFVVAAGSGSAVDVQAAGRRVAEVLGARGGGSGRLFQGKAQSLERRAEALEMLRELARGAG